MMDITLVATLAQAGALLDNAMDQCEANRVFWEECLVTRQAIEGLVGAEVNWRGEPRGTSMMEHNGLPIAGYRPQPEGNVATVNAMQVAEEQLLRRLDTFALNPAIDKRWLAIGRTSLEQAFMAINRSVFRPDRVKLPEDGA